MKSSAEISQCQVCNYSPRSDTHSTDRSDGPQLTGTYIQPKVKCTALLFQKGHACKTLCHVERCQAWTQLGLDAFYHVLDTNQYGKGGSHSERFNYCYVWSAIKLQFASICDFSQHIRLSDHIYMHDCTAKIALIFELYSFRYEQWKSKNKHTTVTIKMSDYLLYILIWIILNYLLYLY